MKIWIILFLYICTSTVSALSNELEIDKIIAIVDDKIILKSDIEQFIFFIKQKEKHNKLSVQNDFIKNKILNKLILDTMILNEADKLNFFVTDEQVNHTIKNIAYKHNISVEQLKNNILFNENNNDFTYFDYFNQIKKLLKIQMIQDYKILSHIKIKKIELQKLFHEFDKRKKFDKINISYILLSLPKNKKQKIVKDQKTLAFYILKKIKNGCSFEELNKKYKINKNFFFLSNSWMNFNDVQNMLSHHLKFSKKGETLGPFLGSKGFYIIKVNDAKNYPEKYIKEFHIQHCLIKFSPILHEEEVKKSIFNIYNNIIKKVYNFDFAVKNFSHDFYSSRKKGDLGWISSLSLNPEFNNILLNLKINETSKPIKSELGWHIVKVLDKRDINYSLKIKKDKIYQMLLTKKIKFLRDKWIQELKKLAFIEVIK
ncbi:peptidylprolyl isomerase [Buchnera aphidicola (Muscaphis stroyani)]|uniref:Peptidylprolyl isomerase n=1 Tax=Buchnera aphidicola (Muscaphis stroyani) TaxID=1241869 RepID=A0A4D6Y563_9GAMM|nr:peptidylprolyl isomerase [Buchnera aphidicola]QCI24239.1 peptidylprolyl isomerase [Buchnera aphidicola (Muscaphis stroyani)]